MDSDYEYDYSDDGFPESDEDMASGDDYEFDNQAELQSASKKAPYLVYNESELRERQQKCVDDVAGVLSVDNGDVVRVLREYKWDAARLQEEWFTDMDAVRDKAGIMERKPASASGKDVCKICFDEYPVKEMRSAACNHRFCKACWKGYISTKIGEGPAVLNMRCPLPDCRAAVPQSIVTEVASEADSKKYCRFALRTFVEDNRQLSWCPSPGCENAIEAKADVAGEPLDISCKCGAAFCFQCNEEAHRPVDCETVHRWILKNSAESENLNWILAHTKQCPKCKRPIEKNQGCMHMTCSQCRYEFCWLCQGGWAEHGERTGGFYNCNRYEVGKKKGQYDEETLKREQAKNALERYMHYYQRWAENDRARLSALEGMKGMVDTKLEKISELTATPTSQLKFLSDAWAQVVDCRRILKWTYAYGYYRFAESAQAQTSAQASTAAEALRQQQEFFEFNQGQAEFFLEKLHGMVEKQVNAFMLGDENVEGWAKFRESLIGLTDVTRTHFDKLVSELERGLDMMLDAYGDSAGQEREDLQGPSAPQPSAAKKKPQRPAKKPRGAASAASAHATVAATSKAPIPDELEAVAGIWQCAYCTLANDLSRSDCSACRNARGTRP